MTCCSLINYFFKNNNCWGIREIKQLQEFFCYYFIPYIDKTNASQIFTNTMPTIATKNGIHSIQRKTDRMQD